MSTFTSTGSQIAHLLPPGVVWNLEGGSTLQRVMVALGDELDRVRLRGIDLINESDPRTATETLADWERMLGLPDERVTAIPGTAEGRRVAITAKYAERGGQSYSYFSALCESTGWPLIQIATYHALVLRAGFYVNDLCYGNAYAFAMRISVDDPLPGALPFADAQRVIAHAAHAHIAAIIEH